VPFGRLGTPLAHLAGGDWQVYARGIGKTNADLVEDSNAGDWWNEHTNFEAGNFENIQERTAGNRQR